MSGIATAVKRQTDKARAPRRGLDLEDFDAPAVRRLEYLAAEDLDDADEDFDDEIVEGVLGRAAMSVMYGDSNSGKTFAAIDLGAAVCRGMPWLGRNAVPGLVLYLATEAAGSVRMRLKAYQRFHGAQARGFIIVQSPVNLFDGEADVTAILATVAEIEARYGERVLLIIGDTLARIAAGANENSGEDMGVVIKHAETIRAATGATFLWIHHCGKDQARGMRGWSGMRAAIDTEIEITADEALGTRAAEITKQRDLPGKGTRIGFRLEAVALGRNRWGTPRDSCVVIGADAPAKVQKAKGRPSEVTGALVEFLTQRGSGCRKSEIVKHFEGRFARGSVYREVDKMVDAGRLLETAGVVALAKKGDA
jgi:putative DNA primase/helicase